ncbi:hypothetical protein MASR1M8_23840 [Thermomonas brevis]
MNPPNHANELFQHYGRHYRAGSEGYFLPLTEIRRYKLDRLPRWLEQAPTSLHVLDAGCANGYQLSLLAEAGFTHLTGVDVSHELTTEARARLGQRATIVTADMAEYLQGLPVASFDAILFHHVIEHVPREALTSLLRQFHRVLRPGGRLNIRTPNANCLGAAPHMYADLTHLVFFNDRGLLQALEAGGFDPLQVTFPAKKPRLLLIPEAPMRSLLRLGNRLRWHLNQLLHRFVYAVSDIRPLTRSFDVELEAVAHKSP